MLILSLGVLTDLFHDLGYFMFIVSLFASVAAGSFVYLMGKRETPFFGAQFELSSVAARRRLEIKDRKILRRLIELRRELKESGAELAAEPDGHNIHEHRQNQAVFGHHQKSKNLTNSRLSIYEGLMYRSCKGYVKTM